MSYEKNIYVVKCTRRYLQKHPRETLSAYELVATIVRQKADMSTNRCV